MHAPESSVELGPIDALRVDVVPEFDPEARDLIRRHSRQEREFWGRVLGRDGRLVYEVASADGAVSALFRAVDDGTSAAEVASWAELLPDGYSAGRQAQASPDRPAGATVTLVRRLELVDLPSERPGSPRISLARRTPRHQQRRREINDRSTGMFRSRSVPVVGRLGRRRGSRRTEPDRWMVLLRRYQPASVSIEVASVASEDARRTRDAEIYEAILGRDPMNGSRHRGGSTDVEADRDTAVAVDDPPASSKGDGRASFAASMFRERAESARIRATLDRLRRPSGELRSAVVRVVAADGHQARNLAYAWAEAHGGARAYWISEPEEASPARREPEEHGHARFPRQLACRAAELGLDDRRDPRMVEVGALMRDLETIFTEAECRTLLRLPIGPSAGLRSSLTNPFVYSPAAWRSNVQASTIRLGRVVSGAEGGAGEPTWHGVEASDLTRHLLIAGGTGSGKSVATRFLLRETHGIGVPFLVIEPAKTEYYDALRGAIPDLKRWRFEGTADGKVDRDFLTYDPMRLSAGVSVARHISYLKTCFTAALPMGEVAALLLENGLRAYYTSPRLDGGDGGCGLGLLSRGGMNAHVALRDGKGQPAVYPSFHTFVRFMLHRYLMADLNPRNLPVPPEYALELHDALRRRFELLSSGLLGVSFRRADDAFLHDRRYWNFFPAFLGRPTVIELDALPNDEEKALVMAFLLSSLCEHRQAEDLLRREAGLGSEPGGPARLAHLLIVEEAHRLLGARAAGGNRGDLAGEGAGSRAVHLFVDMLAEMRAYGQGLGIVEQIPTKLTAEVLKNTNLKMMLRLAAEDDRDVLGEAMNFNRDQKRFAALLRTGQCLVFEDGLERPALLTIPAPATWTSLVPPA
jgi:hypothetical protein